MESIVNAPLESPWVLGITITLFLTGSITTFDIRLNQAKKSGVLPPDEQILPQWVALLYWVHYGLLIWLFFLNWKFAIGLVVVLFVLKVLPVLETIGNILMAPFKKR